jgi:amidase
VTRSLRTPIVADTDVHHSFRADVPPALCVGEREAFTLMTRSILKNGSDELPSSYASLVLPVTGPVTIAGVRAGDTLRVDVLDIEIDSRGAILTVPGYGAFGDSVTWSGEIVHIDDGAVAFGDGTTLPLEPMMGKLGVGTRDAPPANTVGPHGGNMDCKEVHAGSSVYLPVKVAGGFLYAGDLHARQGDGECGLTGVEVAGSVTLACSVASTVSLLRPLVVVGDTATAIGDGATLEEAVSAALTDMARLVQEARGWTLERAVRLLSVAADVGICQLVNPRVSAKVSVPRSVLQTGESGLVGG